MYPKFLFNKPAIKQTEDGQEDLDKNYFDMYSQQCKRSVSFACSHHRVQTGVCANMPMV
jgi:hypothetical protein